MKRIFSGEVKFCVRDADVNLLNKFRKFRLFHVEHFDGGVKFSIPLVHKKEVTRLLGKRDFTAAECKNIFTVLNFFYTRVALVLMSVICIAAFMFSEQFAFRVRLEGVEGTEYAQIRTYMENNGLSGIVKKRAARDPKTATEIVRQFPFVAHACVEIRGSCVIISVARAEKIVVSDAEILATADGYIHDIIVFSGSANVTTGDVVRAGDVLVTGARPMAIIVIKNGQEIVCVINNTVVSSSNGKN
jgi:hypothetical protein